MANPFVWRFKDKMMSIIEKKVLKNLWYLINELNRERM